MKRTYKIVDHKTGKVITKEVKVRALDHFESQLKYKSSVYKPKKGKGSFKRNKRISEKDY